MGCIGVCLKKKWKFWGEAAAVYLASESNKVKLWRQWSRLWVDCCSGLLILCSAPVCKSVGDGLTWKVDSDV